MEKNYPYKIVEAIYCVNAGLIFPFKSGEIFPVLAKKNYAKPTAPTFRRPFIR